MQDILTELNAARTFSRNVHDKSNTFIIIIFFFGFSLIFYGLLWALPSFLLSVSQVAEGLRDRQE